MMARKHISNKENNPAKTTETNPVFFENGYCRGKKTRHGYMIYNPNDLIGQTLDVFGEWSSGEIELLNQLIKPGFVVLDVGANIGTHTLSSSKMVGPSGFVYAFEPQRISFEFLCSNVLINNLINVFPLNAAVSDMQGELMIPVIDPARPSNTGAFQISGYTMGDHIRQVTIDSLDLPGCNLIKIDVEGMENKVIRGAKDTIQKFRPILFIENNGYGDSPDLIKQIIELKYHCWWFFSPPIDPSQPFNPEINDKNMLCLPAEGKANVSGLVPLLDENDSGKAAYARFLMAQTG